MSHNPRNTIVSRHRRNAGGGDVSPKSDFSPDSSASYTGSSADNRFGSPDCQRMGPTRGGLQHNGLLTENAPVEKSRRQKHETETDLAVSVYGCGKIRATRERP